MSVVAVRAALETALNSMTPPLSTAWENVAFNPTAGTPYQAAHVLFASPDNREYGSSHREQGYMQVSLRYPLQVGTATIAARAELIRAKFVRGASFASGGHTVLITRTPEVMSGYVDGDRYVINVKIQFMAQRS